MLHVNIVTIYDSKNYGNRLQNLAVTIVMNKLGFDVTTIDYEKKTYDTFTSKLKRLFHLLTNYIFAKDRDYWKYQLKREIRIGKIDKRYLKTAMISEIKDIPEADYFLIGSDQVWNPAWYDDYKIKKELFLLSFVEPNKRATFAPSFGIEQLPEEWKSTFSRELKKFKSVSVREDAGAKIIRNLTGKDAFVMLDPTLMVDAKTWRRFEKRPKWLIRGPYIVTYFLGGLTERAEKLINNLNIDQQYQVYHLMKKEDCNVYSSNQLEFIYLIDHADLILTDSFHASVFSFLLDKPFMVFDRAGQESSMKSRIDTLLTKFSLERKYVNSDLKNDIYEHDYSESYGVLENERRKSLEFLQNSLGIKTKKNKAAL